MSMNTRNLLEGFGMAAISAGCSLTGTFGEKPESPTVKKAESDPEEPVAAAPSIVDETRQKLAACESKVCEIQYEACLSGIAPSHLVSYRNTYASAGPSAVQKSCEQQASDCLWRSDC